MPIHMLPDIYNRPGISGALPVAAVSGRPAVGVRHADDRKAVYSNAAIRAVAERTSAHPVGWERQSIRSHVRQLLRLDCAIARVSR